MIYSIPDSNRPPPPAEGLTSPRPSWPLSAPCIPSYTRAPPSFEASANTDPTTIRRVKKASRLLNGRLSAPLLRISHLRCGLVQSREASSLCPLPLSPSPIVAIRLHRLLLPVTFFHPVSCLLPRHHTLTQDERRAYSKSSGAPLVHSTSLLLCAALRRFVSFGGLVARSAFSLLPSLSLRP